MMTPAQDFAWAVGFHTSNQPLLGEGNGTPLQYSCLENPMDGEAWQAAVHGVTKSRTRLSNFTFTFHFHALQKEMATTPVFLPGESQGQRSLAGCRLWGRAETDTTEVTSQQQHADIYSIFYFFYTTSDSVCSSIE